MHVDDIIVMDSSSSLSSEVFSNLQSIFSLKDLGEINYFLRIQVTKNPIDLLFSQSKYVTDLLAKVIMQGSTPCSTLIASGVSLTKDDGQPFSNVHLFTSTVGTL